MFSLLKKYVFRNILVVYLLKTKTTNIHYDSTSARDWDYGSCFSQFLCPFNLFSTLATFALPL
jgi:hypothetical protein